MKHKIFRRVLTGLFALCLCFTTSALPAYAEGRKAYTYTVNFIQGIMEVLQVRTMSWSITAKVVLPIRLAEAVRLLRLVA